MRIKKLILTNFRGLKQAEFEFQPGMNVVIGINGAGKSSVLDAIRIGFSQILPRIGMSSAKSMPFLVDDIKIGREYLNVQIEFEVNRYSQTDTSSTQDFVYIARKNALEYKTLQSQQDSEQHTYKLRNMNVLSPDDKDVISNLSESSFVIYYSTRRSLFSRAKPKSQYDLLTHREMSVSELANWLLVKQELARPHIVDMVEGRVTKFLDEYSAMKAVREPKPTIQLEKGDTVLDVSQLSDGERGTLAIVLELSRWIFEFRETCRDCEPIVLIDELDLHLHPSWQRDVIGKLSDTFPECQFIVTTHSPQIVGELPPENIIILEEGKQPYRPDQSLGMDTNWILQFLMGSNPRNQETQNQLDAISDLIEEDKFDLAQEKIDSLREDKLTRDPELVKLQVRLDRLRILKDDNEG